MDWPRQPKSSYLWDQVPASTMLPLRSYLGRRRSLSRSFSLSLHLPLCHSFLLSLSPSRLPLFLVPPCFSFFVLFHVLLLHVRLSLFLSSALSYFPPSWYTLSRSFFSLSPPSISLSLSPSLSTSTSPSSSFSLPPFNLAPSHSDPVSAAVLAVVSPVPSHCFTFRVTCCPMHRTRLTVRLYSPTASWIRRRRRRRHRVNFALATVSPQPRSSATRRWNGRDLSTRVFQFSPRYRLSFLRFRRLVEHQKGRTEDENRRSLGVSRSGPSKESVRRQKRILRRSLRFWHWFSYRLKNWTRYSRVGL